MKPLLTPWYPFGHGLQRTLRRPYLDAEVQPVDGGWMWRVADVTGAVVARGHQLTQAMACGRAMLVMMGEAAP